jgi:methylase of polypeptide subunit release factors
LVDLLCAPKAQRILAHYGPEALRYRIEWAAQGRRRQATRELVSALSARYPQWINDPEQRHWEFVAKLQGQQLRLELEPRFEDRRFAYRLQDVPAASHPTIAAALARLAQPQSQDMIWDPFVGSGTELIECARLAPGCRLLGSDLAAGALEAAKLNSEAAGVKIALQQADALSMHPRGLRLIVSNPPMGQRVRFEESADAFFSRAFRHFASLLGRGGALLWATSRPDTVRALGPNVGLQLQREIAVDMGGFDATLQRWERL